MPRSLEIRNAGAASTQWPVRTATARPGAERSRRRAGGNSDRRLHLRTGPRTRRAGMDQARLGRDLPRGADAPGDVRQPVPCGLGWADGEDRVLGASNRWRPVPGVRDQLRAPRLPGAMVPAVAAIHVPLSRRGVLRGRLARLRAAAPGTLRVPGPDPAGAAPGARRPGPDACGARGASLPEWCPRVPRRF